MVGDFCIPDQLRKNVWDGRLDSDYLRRYYGLCAAKETWNVTITTTVGCVIAFASALAASDASLPLWLPVIVSLLGVAVAIKALAYGHRRIIDALFCQHELADLCIDWDDLWARVEDGSDSADEVRSRWRDLSVRANAITAPRAQDRIKIRLAKQAEKESNDHYSPESRSASVVLT